MTIHVLDTSAILAYFWQEPGWEMVADILSQKNHVVSSVNLAELVGKARLEGMPEPAVEDMLDSLELDVREFNSEQALVCGLLQPTTRPAGLSLGDRACLALAKSLDAVAVTADRPWLALNLDIRVDCIRPAKG
jgi:PIN domain nuclease of toxin-antitoxin system